MVKFSDISKLWKDPEEQPRKDGKSKKSAPDKDELSRPGQLKTPDVAHPKVISISHIPEKEPLAHPAQPRGGQDKVKYSAGSAKPGSETIGAPNDEISFRNIDTSINTSAPEDAKLNIAQVAKHDDKMVQAASALYDKLYAANREAINLINGNTSNRIDIRELIQLIKETVAFMDSNQPALVGFTYRDPRQDYFISHQVNTVIFSLAIGSGLGYSQGQLEELGLTAFLHDVAMQELPGVADGSEQKPDVVKSEVIKDYIKSGLQVLRQIPFLPAVILEVCRQYHENYHGGQSGVVHEYAQIMRMADSFESLTHYRPNRVTKTAQAALHELIDAADTDFARKVLKILIKQVGIYPVGTFVLLNTQEIAEVARSNENFPLRPVINVLQAEGDKLALVRTVDLLANPSLYVTGTLTREDALARAKTGEGS